MRFSTAFVWMQHGKKMRVPGFKGYWKWDFFEKTIVIVTKDNQHIDIRKTDDVSFTIGFINSDEWEFYEGHEDPTKSA